MITKTLAIMDSLERKFKAIMLDRFVNKHQYEVFQKSNTNIYSGMFEAFKEIQREGIKTEYPILLKTDISKVTLKKERKIFIFAGCFDWKGKSIVLLEKYDTFGTVYLDNARMVGKLKDFRIGSKIGMKLDDDESVHLTLPTDVIKHGLFNEDEVQ